MKQWMIPGILVTLLYSTTAFAEMVVIVNKKNPVSTLTADTVANYFKRAIELWDSGNQKIDPVDLPEAHPLTVEFTTRVMRMTVNIKESMWMIKTLSGKGTRPKQVMDEKAVVSYVAAQPGAIGYVDRASVNDAVRIVDIKF